VRPDAGQSDSAGGERPDGSGFVGRALALWGRPLPPGDAALGAFRAVYADPVLVNGTPTALSVLVERARMMQAAFEGLRHTVLEEFAAPGRLAFAFRISGRLVGPLATPIGELPPSGAEVEVAGMDIFVVDEARDRITAVWALADYLTLLVNAGAVPSLAPPAPAPPG
jgi:predicted ester cyclase